VNTEIVVWLAIAVLALVWANLSLLRARRALSRSRQESLLQELSSVSTPASIPSAAEAASPAFAP
jgi:hypothetical protein